MRRNRSVVRRQILLSAPSGEVCLHHACQPCFRPCCRSLTPQFVFFLTAFPHSDILKRIRCDHDELVGSANSKGVGGVPLLSNNRDRAN